ncbi:MAG: hypothetical protein ACHP9Z_18205 [Streptosporangiales bacterium]
MNVMAHVEAASRGFERDRRSATHDSSREKEGSRDRRRDRHDDGGEDNRDR